MEEVFIPDISGTIVTCWILTAPFTISSVLHHPFKPNHEIIDIAKRAPIYES